MPDRKYILPLAFAALLTCIGGTADYVLDDVYYWADAEAPQEVVWEYYPEEQPMEQPVVPRAVEITFLNDSITQRSDTVVRAVIRRE